VEDEARRLFEPLEAEALRALESPPFGGRILLQLWEQIPMGNHLMWTVYTNRRTGILGPIARQAVWKRWHDTARFHDTTKANWSPKPTMSVREKPIPQEDFQARMHEASQIAIPLINVERLSGVEGTTWGVQFPDQFGGFRLNWWYTGPRQWQPLIAWVHDMRAWLIKELANK
jgi:hypothetical protein